MAGTPARAWFERFDIGCPNGLCRRANQQSNRYDLVKTPSYFARNKHALEQPVGLGVPVGFVSGIAFDGRIFGRQNDGWQN